MIVQPPIGIDSKVRGAKVTQSREGGSVLLCGLRLRLLILEGKYFSGKYRRESMAICSI
jgi:hypothetical protein